MVSRIQYHFFKQTSELEGVLVEPDNEMFMTLRKIRNMIKTIISLFHLMVFLKYIN